MDIQNVATQLIGFLGQNPQLIEQFIEHPYSTTAQATGSDVQISKEDMSQVVTAAAALSNNQQLPSNDVATIASALMGQNNNSVHALTSMLFGGGTTQQATAQAQAQTTPSGTLNLGSLVNMASLAATLMGGTAAATAANPKPKPAVDISDGLDLGEIAILAGQFLGGGASSSSAAQAPQQAAASPSIDFGTIAQLASTFLKQK